jgi:hypothetical protein
MVYLVADLTMTMTVLLLQKSKVLLEKSKVVHNKKKKKDRPNKDLINTMNITPFFY